ncbi:MULTISPECIES: hypothetical protein [Photobacterium]|uniref:hypothetical protein n=1 Tax=Photobacterium TaxID=657 RepID=UPI002E188579|nr:MULTISPECIES: hypothetical protein [Photobacterium]MEC6796349.1 hypothetical protein [Photobacterium sp. S4TG1]MEC6907436.1 hypothetical protein [Photobacterium piscicola]
MKVVIEILESGTYRDQAWEGTFLSTKGELRAVTPSYAAQLIGQEKAALYLDNNGEMKFA